MRFVMIDDYALNFNAWQSSVCVCVTNKHADIHLAHNENRINSLFIWMWQIQSDDGNTYRLHQLNPLSPKIHTTLPLPYKMKEPSVCSPKLKSNKTKQCNTNQTAND